MPRIPDRARSRGLPQEFIEVAEAKAKAINAAFEAAMRERREMALAGAAFVVRRPLLMSAPSCAAGPRP